MILIDYSSILHRMLNYAPIELKLKTVNGKYVTDEYIDFVKYKIVKHIHSIYKTHKNMYGEIVLCIDNTDKPYWRTEYYPFYKLHRKKLRSASPINHEEAVPRLKDLEELFTNSFPFKVVSVAGAEADDIMLILARECVKRKETCLIVSPDKDMIQAQINNNYVKQYSYLTKKYIEKEGDINDWLLEHVCLGDTSDNVPRIVDNTTFTEEFKEHIEKHNLPMVTEKQFNFFDTKLVHAYTKGFDGVIFEKPKFGIVKLKKEIEKYGSLEKYIETNEIYKINYDRNKRLVLESGIPENIINDILVEYEKAETLCDFGNITEYFDRYKLNKLTNDIRRDFDNGNYRKLDESFFIW